jgi:hypothetical protein
MSFVFEKSILGLNEIRPAPWRAVHVLKPDLKVLVESIREYGLINPIVVHKQTGLIIDGFHRAVAIQGDKELSKIYKKGIQSLVVECSETDSMLMHIRLNRARGGIVLHHLSRLVKQIYQSGTQNLYELEESLGMTSMELDALLDGSLIKSRKVSEHQYSKAWVPVEAPAGKVDSMAVERPPNPDR